MNSLLELAKKRGIQPAGSLIQKAQESGMQPTTFPTQEPVQVKQSFMQMLGTSFKQGLNDFYQGSVKPLGHAVDPFIKVAGSGVRELQSIPAFLRGDYAQSQEIAKRPIFGQKTLEGSTNLENLGSAIEVGSNLLTGGSYKGVKESLFQAGKQGFKQGSAVGLGGYLANEENPTFGGAAKSTLTGGLTGGISAAGVSALLPIVSGEKTISQFARENLTPEGLKGKLQKKFVSDLRSGYDELFGGTKSGNKQLNKSLNQGKNPSQLLSENGYIVDTKKVNGRYQVDAQPTIQQIRSQEIDPLETTLDQILQAKDKVLSTDQYINLDDLSTLAKKRAVSPQTKGSATLPKIYKEIDGIIDDLKMTYGDQVNFSQLNEIKKGQWSQVGTFDPTSPKYMGDVNRSVGQASRKIIEKSVPEANTINGRLGDWYDAVSNLNKVDGGVVKGGKIGSYVNRAIGAIIGTHLGGLPGGIAGDLAGGFVSDLMQSTTLTNPMKRAILESIPKDTSIYTQAQEALSKLKYGQALLPEGRGAGVQSNVPINLPAKSQSTLDAAEIANTKSTRVVRPKAVPQTNEVSQVFYEPKTKIPKIHVEDQQVMKEFIDQVRLKKAPNIELELDAARVAEHYGLKTPKNLSGLANEFDKFLADLEQNMGQNTQVKSFNS